MKRAPYRVGSALALLSLPLALAYCGGGGEASDAGDAGSRADGSTSPGTGASGDTSVGDAAGDSATNATTYDAGLGDAAPVDGGSCALMASTYATGAVSPSGCRTLVRDNGACAAARIAQGLSGFWLKFSCRVTLAVVGANVQAQSDGQPDYRSNYFASSNACYEPYTGGNPNLIAARSYLIEFPRAPSMSATRMTGAVVGLALNGVPVFGNFAAPGDDIFLERTSFDRCGAHPQMTGMYHYHSEPYAISYDDARFIGVLRDGYPVYGRRDPDGSYPMLDAYGGHSGFTADSPSEGVYHYHVNEQTSSGDASLGQKQWFLTKGTYRGQPAPCATCN